MSGSLTPGIYTVAACGCTESAGRTITDPVRHAAWHKLVEEQATRGGSR